jgi:hypothetical protein
MEGGHGQGWLNVLGEDMTLEVGVEWPRAASPVKILEASS